MIIDFAISYDNKIDTKEIEETEKNFLNLASVMKRQWKTNVIIIPVIIGAFSTTTKLLPNRLKDTGNATCIVV